MNRVSVEIDGKTESTEISFDTYELLRDGSALRNRPIEWFLSRVVKEYGGLTEKNIIKFMDEKWVL